MEILKREITTKKEWKKVLLMALKIAVGSSAAIYVAQFLGLQNAASAGTIAMLTLVTTKWETVRLSLYRIITYVIAAVLAGVTFHLLDSQWISYGIYIFLLIAVSYAFGWKATVSVNAVIGTHFLIHRDFGAAFVWNEFLLVLIGITAALILNLFYDYRSLRNDLVRSMRRTEDQLQMILGELAAYLSDKEMQRDVWADIRDLEAALQDYIRDACEYQDNTFHSHPGYYIDYFEMRMKQLNILHNLHYEVKKIRKIPAQAKIVAEFILYLTDYVVERNSPEEQIGRLEQIFREMREEPLPVTRDEFENRAVLYHILMDLEEFLIVKKRFVIGLNETQRYLYWNRKEAGKDNGREKER